MSVGIKSTSTIIEEAPAVKEGISSELEDVDLTAFGDLVSSIETGSDIVYILSTVTGVKNGFSFVDLVETEFQSPSRYWLSNHLDRLGIPYKATIIDGNLSSKNQLVILGEKEEQFLNSLPPLETYPSFNDFTKDNGEEFGKLIGVPEEDLLWFEEENSPDIKKVTPITEKVNTSNMEIKESEFKYARLVSWVSRPTPGGIKRAVANGKKFYESNIRISSLVGDEKPRKAVQEEMGDIEHCWYPLA